MRFKPRLVVLALAPWLRAYALTTAKPAQNTILQAAYNAVERFVLTPIEQFGVDPPRWFIAERERY
jgi:hypothetical protein